jgi:hypothetical protein
VTHFDWQFPVGTLKSLLQLHVLTGIIHTKVRDAYSLLVPLIVELPVGSIIPSFEENIFEAAYDSIAKTIKEKKSW